MPANSTDKLAFTVTHANKLTQFKNILSTVKTQTYFTQKTTVINTQMK